MFWNETSGILALASLQDPNGSFSNDLYGTTDALLAISTLLNGSGLLDLKRHRCTTYTYHPFDSLSPITEGAPKDTTTTNSTTAHTPTSPNQLSNTESVKGPTPSESVSPPQSQDTTDNSLVETTGLVDEKEVTTGRGAASLTPDSSLVTVKYFLWIGPDPPTAEKHNLTIQVSTNTTFFRIMQRAAELDSAYE